MTTLLLVLGLLLLAGAAPAQPQDERDAVILLHGLGRGRFAMKLLERRLGAAGFRVHNLAYSARADSMAELVAELHAGYIACCRRDAGRVHFVSHSLGGLVVRAYLAEHRPARLGRAVMLAPPNGGSEIVDRFRGRAWFRIAFGTLAQKLGTRAEDLPARLPVPDCEIGIIAGNRWINPVGYFVLPAPHDGTVAVRRTHLAGAGDHLIVPHTHTFIMNSARVARETVHFLRHGRFAR